MIISIVNILFTIYNFSLFLWIYLMIGNILLFKKDIHVLIIFPRIIQNIYAYSVQQKIRLITVSGNIRIEK